MKRALLKRFSLGERSERGDTIVEVMIVLAVLGMAIGISYATANRSLLNARQAQENSQASELVQSQLEQLRTMTKNNCTTAPVDTAHCIYSGSPYGSSTSPFCVVSGVVKNAKTDASCLKAGESGRYRLTITRDNSTDTFTIVASWDDVEGEGTDTVTLNYKVHPEVATIVCPEPDESPADGCTPPPPLPTLRVVVKTIPHGTVGTATDPTPSCGAAAGNAGGTSVTLRTSSGALVGTQTTDSTSSTIFSNLQASQSYTATINRSGWQVCPGGGALPTTTSGSTGPRGSNNSLPQVIIYPKCYIASYYYNNYWTYGGNRGDLNGWWKFGSTTPDTAYTETVTRSGGVVQTDPYPNYWYFVGTGSYEYSNGAWYRYYYVYDAVWHSDLTPRYGCPGG